MSITPTTALWATIRDHFLILGCGNFSKKTFFRFSVILEVYSGYRHQNDVMCYSSSAIVPQQGPELSHQIEFFVIRQILKHKLVGFRNQIILFNKQYKNKMVDLIMSSQARDTIVC